MPQAQEEKWTCPGCNEEFDATVSACPKCGWKQDEEDEQLTTTPAKPMRTHYAQAVIITRDNSISMRGTKSRDANKAVASLISELCKAEHREGFFVSVVDFGDDAAITLPLTKAAEANSKLSPINPTSMTTNITAALRTLIDLVSDKQAFKIEGYRFKDPVVVFFTDGVHTAEGTDPPVSAGEDLKQLATVVTAPFGKDADKNLLEAIASSPAHCYPCNDGAELGRFMSEVGKTVVKTATGDISTQTALGNLPT